MESFENNNEKNEGFKEGFGFIIMIAVIVIILLTSLKFIIG
jgi:hypothetical protein